MEDSSSQKTPVVRQSPSQVEYIPRSKPSKSYLQRKIEQYQTEAWGPEKRELDLIPHIGKLERELKQLRESKLQGGNFDEEVEVKKLVDQMFKSISGEQLPLGESFVSRKSKLEQEQENFRNSLRSSGAQGEQMDTTLHENQNTPINQNFGGAGLGDILKIHKSSLMKEQELYKQQQELFFEQENSMDSQFQNQLQTDKISGVGSKPENNDIQNQITDDPMQGGGGEEEDFHYQQNKNFKMVNNSDCCLMEMAQTYGNVNFGQSCQVPLTPQVSRNNQFNFEQGARTVPIKTDKYVVNFHEDLQGQKQVVEEMEQMDCVVDEDVENEQPNNKKEDNMLTTNKDSRSLLSASKNKRDIQTPKKVMSPVDEALAELTKLQARTMEPNNRYHSPSPKGSV